MLFDACVVVLEEKVTRQWINPRRIIQILHSTSTGHSHWVCSRQLVWVIALSWSSLHEERICVPWCSGLLLCQNCKTCKLEGIIAHSSRLSCRHRRLHSVLSGILWNLRCSSTWKVTPKLMLKSDSRQASFGLLAADTGGNSKRENNRENFQFLSAAV